jgi:hypothetical protein
MFRLLQKAIDQKKRAVITRPFGREARIVPRKALICKALQPISAGAGGVLPPAARSAIR